MKSGVTLIRISAFSMPTCTAPRLPPPANTNAVRGACDPDACDSIPTQVDSVLFALWEPSQNGLFPDRPQRQSHERGPHSSVADPSAAVSEKLPSIVYGPSVPTETRSTPDCNGAPDSASVTIPLSSNPMRSWLLSQKGLLREAPQRQSATRVSRITPSAVWISMFPFR